MTETFAYGSITDTSLPIREALTKTKELLRRENFVVLSEIDVAKVIKEQIDTEFKPYVILGVCSPGLVMRALKRDEHIGLLLPCNIVLTAHERGTRVAVVNVASLLSAAGNPAFEPIVTSANEHRLNVLAELPPYDTAA